MRKITQVTFREVEVEVVLSPRLDLHLAREHVLVEPHADQLLGERLLQFSQYSKEVHTCLEIRVRNYAWFEWSIG